MRYWLTILLFAQLYASSQNAVYNLKGRVLDERGEGLPFILVGLENSKLNAITNENGTFEIKDLQAGSYHLVIAQSNYEKKRLKIQIPAAFQLVRLVRNNTDLNEVVVTGTMKEVHKDDSPINIDIITPQLFQKTATANLFEATSLVNGVKPQINCNVCNTGDIHINGMEGPYTLILIDGMPIVSGLSSVYGLMGIPASMIDRLEIAKGPAGALYGSEAMGGTINLITKRASQAPRVFLDYYATTYQENNLDLSTKVNLGSKVNWLLGANAFYFDNKVDVNHDGFTDVALQKRISLFNKFSIERKSGKEFSIAARSVIEDRWGGELNWNKSFRGGDSVYGENINTNRTEFISKYEWPGREKIFSQVSYNFHDQNSVYGKTTFLAKQSTAFAQTYWTKQIARTNDLLVGISYKNLWYDDNTSVTSDEFGIQNQPEINNTLGAFVQDEMTLDSAAKHKLLWGIRIDYHDIYKFIPSPRIAYKWSPNYKLIFRLNAGTGFRIVNVFTEDHAALTGARSVVFVEKIRPEQSYNATFNAMYKMKFTRTSMIIWDASVFYYYFTNKIVANYDQDPSKVIYDNLDGYAYSKGFSLNASLANPGKMKFNAGITYSDVQTITMNDLGELTETKQLLTPLWSGNINGGYEIPRWNAKIDLTANWYGPQRLPIHPNDFRPEYSPWFCLLNMQLSKTFKEKFEFYAGGKNLLNFLPQNPILRPQDPFNKKADDLITNPNGYTFDPSYNYAPMQAIRFYVGFRLTVR